MFKYLFILSLYVCGCTTPYASRTVSSTDEQMVGEFFCPVRGSAQVTIEDAYQAIPVGSAWGDMAFSEPSKDIMETFAYTQITEPNYNPKQGAFLIGPGHFSSPCHRQIHLEKSAGTDTNVWSGKVYVDICWTPAEGPTTFVPKEGVLEFANTQQNRTKQELQQLWFTKTKKGKKEICNMEVRVARMDEDEGRIIGVQNKYKFQRTE